MLTTLFAAWAAPCDPGTLDALLGQAESAFGRRDPAALHDALARVDPGCASNEGVARLYRSQALDAVLRSDEKAAREAFRASLAAHPLLPLPAVLAADATVTALFQQAQEDGIRWRSAQMATVNGVRTPLRPDTSHRARDVHGRNYRVAGLGFGLISAGLYGAAWASRKNFDRSEGQPAIERLPSYRATNGLALTSLGTALLGGTLFTISFTR